MRINNIFGPTIQGEGPLLGKPSDFIRTQGCDSACSWCDTKYAQDENDGNEMSITAIVENLTSLGNGNHPIWITITGGNPCLVGAEMGGLIDCLKESKSYMVAVETQGTIWQPWLLKADLVTVSPKPFLRIDDKFIENALAFYWKVVAFNFSDIHYANRIADQVHQCVYLQIGRRWEETQASYLNRCLSLADEVCCLIRDHGIGKQLIVTPQWHTLLWGNDPDK